MWLKLLVLALFFSASLEQNLFCDDYGEGIPEARDLLRKLATYDEFISPYEGEILCGTCSLFFNNIIGQIRNGTSEEEIITDVINLCNTLGLFNEAVCAGAVSLHAPILYYIIVNRPEVDGERACAVIAQSLGCQFPDSPPNWEISIHDGETVQKAEGNNIAFNVLHLTDVHYDPNYTPGSLIDCKLPVCCQMDSGKPVNESDSAGFWSSYGACDTPEVMFDEALKFISENHQFDYIYYTGDIVHHRAWATDIYNNSLDITLIFNKIADAFPGVPYFPILGNHEPHPFNVWSEGFEGTEFSTQWLFDLSAEVWGQWLPADTQETILKGGYYTVLVKPGFRIVALNSNVCFVFNWWLLYDDVDPYGQLAWFENVMYEAEQNNEIVHVLSHVPGGDTTCYIPWARELRRIINRYTNSIAGIFNGHTHLDELEIYFDPIDPAKATNIAWNGGALTSYTDHNPNYRIYQVDSASYDILDFEEWYFNVTEANLTPDLPPIYYKLYNFKEAYGLNDLTPASISDLVVRMTANSSLTDLYWRFGHRNSDVLLPNGCDTTCAKTNICKMVTSLHGDSTQCDYFTGLMPVD